MRRLFGSLLEDTAVEHAREVASAADAAAESLIRRARFLSQEDQLLLTCVWQMRLSLRRTAGLVGKTVGAVSRRLRRLQALLNEPHIEQLVEGTCNLSPVDRELAIGHFLRHQSGKQLATSLGMSVHEVRRRLSYLEGWARGMSHKRPK